MCGILGLLDLQQKSEGIKSFDAALKTLHHRGPDHQQTLKEGNLRLGHARLSIIDLDKRANQPMTDMSGRYSLVFNGEIYNYKELRNDCEQLGYRFLTESDTEVLLVMMLHHGKAALQKLNGFFAFAFYDREEKSLLVARDRFGIKPLVFHADEEKFAFASELKALLALNYPKEIDKVSLFTYFKFNYIPAPNTILKNYHKLEPGNLLEVKWNEKGVELKKEQWFSIPYDPEEEKKPNAHDYKQSQKVLKRFMRESVRRRLNADVPVGTFLSGGVDSSIISAIAAEEQEGIEAFSIGFPDQPYFDESGYARTVAKHIGIKHHVFEVRSEELLESANEVLTHLDEPFADSSALNVYLLARFTRQHVKVALSGDGGDELFGGYHKHAAELRLREPKVIDHFVGRLDTVWDSLPSSRSGKVANLVRQLQKFSDGYQLNTRDRYWRWAGILKEEDANFFLKEELLNREQRLSDEGHEYKKRKDLLLRNLRKGGSFNEVLLSDMQMVLPNDMLYKVDSMSMAHALEVRTPMLDQHVVKHAFKMPVMFKVNQFSKKKVLADAYRDLLPSEVFDRSKKGFEVPLLEWFNGPMKTTFTQICNDRDFIQHQGLLNQVAIDDLHTKLYSKKPGDTATTAWALLVFQSWYKQHFA